MFDLPHAFARSFVHTFMGRNSTPKFVHPPPTLFYFILNLPRDGKWKFVFVLRLKMRALLGLFFLIFETKIVKRYCNILYHFTEWRKNVALFGVPLQLSGFVCTLHPATPGLSRKAKHLCFYQFIFELCHVEMTKMKKKKPGLTHF